MSIPGSEDILQGYGYHYYSKMYALLPASVANMTDVPVYTSGPTPKEIIDALAPNSAVLWVAPMLVYLSPRFYHTLKSTAFSRAYQMPFTLFAFHVFISFVELVKYHSQVYLSNGAPQTATLFDAVTCVLQCWTSLYITSQHHLLPKAAMEATRATFHCMSLQRLLATSIALYTGSSKWHVASVMLLNNFIWARIIIGSKIGKLSWKQKYVVGIVGSHLLGMYNGDYPHGIAIYCALMWLLMNITGWAKGRDGYVPNTLRYLGFATRPEWYEKNEKKVEKKIEKS